MIQVVTWLWSNGLHPKKGILFTAEHVNRLYASLRRNTTIEWEPVCITDNPKGLDSAIRVIPIWDEFREHGGCFVRLKAFSEEMRDLIGPRFCWLDIDSVITGNMDAILGTHEDFKMWGDTHPTTPYNGSLLVMTAGCRKQVYETFEYRKAKREALIRNYVGTDQAWIASSLGPNEPTFTKQDGIYSFRLDFKRVERVALPANAKIVMFHGASDPSKKDLQAIYPWIAEHWG